MECGVPSEVIRRDVHRCGYSVAMGTKQVSPSAGVIVTKAFCVLTLEGDDVRPYVACVTLHLLHRRIEIDVIFVTKQSMTSQALGAWTSGNILCVDLGALRRCWVIRHDLHVLTSANVPEIAFRAASGSALDIWTLDNQPCHVPLSPASRT